MKTRHTLLPGLTGALLAMTALSASAQVPPYTYGDPVTSRDSGLTCVGGTLDDEQNLDREPDRGTITKKGVRAGKLIRVFCPLTRRNIVPYGRAAKSRDQALINKVTIFVRSLSSSRSVSCRVHAFKALTGQVHVTAEKYACTESGGCSEPPSNPRVGWTSLVFDGPFPSDSNENKGIVSIGYRCDLPDNRSGIIGSEALYQSAIVQ